MIAMTTSNSINVNPRRPRTADLMEMILPYHDLMKNGENAADYCKVIRRFSRRQGHVHLY